MKKRTNCRSSSAHHKGLESLRLHVKTTLTDPLCELRHMDKQEGAQNCSEMGTSCCVFDIDKTLQQGNTNHCHGIHPQSGFEIFCDRRGIDPLTLDRKGLQRIALDFAEYQNQIRRKRGGRKIPLSQVYKDVRDYIEERKSYSCN